MDCRRFRVLLPRFVAGDVPEPLFGELVEHEAYCGSCHQMAAEAVAGSDPGEVKSWGVRQQERLEGILARTTGRDCDFIQLRLAEALDERLPAELVKRIQIHVRECPSCKRMRDLLEHLPEYYDALPVLHPDRSFTKAVLARTIGPQPRLWEVLRAIWRKPEAVWEAAFACALVAVFLIGSAVPSYNEVSDKVQGVAEYAGFPDVARIGEVIGSTQKESESKVFAPVRDGFQAVKGRWERLEAWAVGASAWAERMGGDARSGNLQGLLEDIRVVLEPVGLYPGNDGSEEAESTSATEQPTPEGEEE